jgi:transcriptional regulator with XRE-family HTH domain
LTAKRGQAESKVGHRMADRREETGLSDLDRALGEVIRRVRTERGLSLRRLAARCEGAFKPSSLGGYERGERSLSMDRFVRLADSLGVSPERLLSDALGRISKGGRPQVTVDTSLLPATETGNATAAFAHEVRARRSDLRSAVITLRSGDLDTIARSLDLPTAETLSGLGSAALRLGPEHPTSAG